MSLNQILKDIQGDANNVSVSNEHVTLGTENQESAFKVPSTNLNKQVMDKFNTLYNVLTAKNTIYPLNKVDSKIAQEVFTMLPEIDKTEQAKITSQPSVINKNILEGVLQNVSATMPDEILAAFGDLMQQIQNNSENILKVTEGIPVYSTVCETSIEYFSTNKPIVIVNRESLDLFTTDLHRCSYIDDTQLDYDRFANKLTTMFDSLVRDETLKTFLTYRVEQEESNAISRFPDTNLHDLCTRITHLKNAVASEKQFLENYMNSLNIALSEEVKAITDNSVYLVNNAESVVNTLNFFKMLYDILELNDHFFEKTKNLLEFIR